MRPRLAAVLVLGLLSVTAAYQAFVFLPADLALGEARELRGTGAPVTFLAVDDDFVYFFDRSCAAIDARSPYKCSAEADTYVAIGIDSGRRTVLFKSDDAPPGTLYPERLVADGNILSRSALVDLRSGTRTPLPWNDTFQPKGRSGDLVVGDEQGVLKLASLREPERPPMPTPWQLNESGDFEWSVPAANSRHAIIAVSRPPSFIARIFLLDLSTGNARELEDSRGHSSCFLRDLCAIDMTENHILGVLDASQANQLILWDARTLEPLWTRALPGELGYPLSIGERWWVADVGEGFRWGALADSVGRTRFDVLHQSIKTGGAHIVTSDANGRVWIYEPGTLPWPAIAAAALSIALLSAALGFLYFRRD